MSTKQYTYIGPYCKFPTNDKLLWRGVEATGQKLVPLNINGNNAGTLDIWTPNVGDFNLWDENTEEREVEPAEVAALLARFNATFEQELATLTALYGKKPTVHFGVLTYWV